MDAHAHTCKLAAACTRPVTSTAVVAGLRHLPGMRRTTSFMIRATSSGLSRARNRYSVVWSRTEHRSRAERRRHMFDTHPTLSYRANGTARISRRAATFEATEIVSVQPYSRVIAHEAHSSARADSNEATKPFAMRAEATPDWSVHPFRSHVAARPVPSLRNPQNTSCSTKRMIVFRHDLYVTGTVVIER